MRGGTRLLMFVALAAANPARAQADAPELPAWMAGCWITEPSADGRRSEECWTVARGTMMLGSGHSFDAHKTLDFEHMRIVRENDVIAFFGQPKGTPPTRFVMDRHVAQQAGAAEVSFVNAAHDYPQRITYRLVGGNLEAEIALHDGSRPVKWTFKRA